MRILVATIYFICFQMILIAQGQVTQEVIDAFSESYVHEQNGDYVQARNELMKVYRQNSYEINLRLGWLYYNEGNYSSSKTMYGRATKLMPYAIEAKLGYALPLSAMGNWTEVINTYQEILKIDPQNSVVNYRLGSIYYDRKEYATAFKYIEKVVNMHPFDYDSSLLFAWIKLRMGQLREAQVLFRKVLLIRPNDSSAKEGLDMIK